MKKMLFIISLLAASTSFAEIATTAVSTERQNELLYFIRHDCGSCHGMTLKGGLGPALLPETLEGKPKSYLVDTIMEGRQNTAMPPWKSMLTLNEASWITDQLQQGLLQQNELSRSNQASTDQTKTRKTSANKTRSKP